MIDKSRGEAFIARITRAVAVAALVAAAAVDASAQFCSNCILNSASPQVATFNVGTGTVRGIFTASTGTFVYLNATNLNITNISGSGAAITALNASQLASGTVPVARLSGSYTGITGVGTLAAGTWQGGVIAPAYGGTGANLSISGTAGGLPYFTGSGVQSVVTSPAGPRVLMTAGSGAAPTWTNTPTLVGTNFSAIPLTALSNGTLQAGIQVPNASLIAIDAAKVSGNISGGAAFLTVDLPISDLAAGTLPTTNAASSVTASGVAPGYYGGPSTLAQIHVNYDGRIDVANQYNIVFYSTGMAPGTLPPGVLLPAGQVSSGTLAGDVVASSVAASGVVLGTYGGVSKALTAVVGIDGRLTSLTQANIALPLSQLNSGNLPSGVKLPAASVNAGNLGSGVVAQTLAANGVAAGTYGSSTVSPQLTVGTDGRITSITQFTIPSVSTSVAFVNVDNNWAATQTSRSSWTATAFRATGIGFAGIGSALTAITAANISAGYLGASVIASSVNVRAVGNEQLTTTGVSASSKGSATRSAVVTVDAQGRLTVLTDAGIAISTGEVSGIVQVANGGTGADWSAVTVGRLPYFSGTGALSTLAAGSANELLASGGAGAPSWTGSPTILGTNITGTASGLNIGGNAASATLAVAATNLVGGLLGSLPYQSAANTSAFLAAGSGVIQESGGAPAWTTSPTITGGNITAIPAANISSGYLGAFVIASSVNVSGVTAGTYGSSGASHPNITIGVDGRITSAANVSIAIAASQVTSGQLAIAQGGTALASAGGTANRVLRTSDGSTFAMGQIIGPDIAAGTIPVSGLNQSGASATNVLAWNGSAWAPAVGASGNMLTTANNTMVSGGGITLPTGSTLAINGGQFSLSSTTITGQEVWIASADWTSAFIDTAPFQNLISTMEYVAYFTCVSSYALHVGVRMGGQETTAGWQNTENYCHIGGCSWGGSSVLRTTNSMPYDGDVSGVATVNANTPWKCRVEFGTGKSVVGTGEGQQYLTWDSTCGASMNYDATPIRSKQWVEATWQGSVTNPYSLSFITTNTTSANGPNTPGNIRCHIDLYQQIGYRRGS